MIRSLRFIHRRFLALRLIGVASVIALAISGCFPIPVKVASSPRTFDASQIDGVWYVVASNFPPWTGHKKSNPTFRYTLRPDNGEPRLLDDIVWFQEDGSPSTYVGVDEQDTGDSVHFTWSGSGALFLFSSEWYVAGVAPDNAWAIVYYTSTIASPDGVDIIARTPNLPEDRLNEARAVIAGDPLLRERAKGLIVVKRTDYQHPSIP